MQSYLRALDSNQRSVHIQTYKIWRQQLRRVCDCNGFVKTSVSHGLTRTDWSTKIGMSVNERKWLAAFRKWHASVGVMITIWQLCKKIHISFGYIGFKIYHSICEACLWKFSWFLCCVSCGLLPVSLSFCIVYITISHLQQVSSLPIG